MNRLELAPSWLILVGVAFFMLFFTMQSLPDGELKTFLFMGWAGVVLLASFETMGEFRARNGASSDTAFYEFHNRIQRRARARRRRARL